MRKTALIPTASSTRGGRSAGVISRSLSTTMARCTAVVFIATMLSSTMAFAGNRSQQELQWVKIEKAYARYKRSNFRQAPDVKVSDILSTSDRTVVFVDVRTWDERAVSTIPGAISADQFEAELYRYRKATVVVYDTVGLRSGIYTNDLRRRNVNAYTLVGGVLAWAHAGQIFENNIGETTQVHVNNKKWSAVPDGYDSMW